MEKPYPVIEFEAEVGPDGTLRIPDHAIAQIPAGHSIVVRITPGTVGAGLRHRGVTEQEIESIALTQREERESVLAFLRADGALSGRGEFQRRAAALLERR